MKVLLLCLLLASPVSAQTLGGTVTWTHTRTTDLVGYKIAVDSAPAIDAGLPATNSTTLPLSVGPHSVTVSACYTSAICLPSVALAVTVVDPNGPAALIANISPASGSIVKLAVSTTTGVTPTATASDPSGIKSCQGHWIIGTQDNTKGCTMNGTFYSFTEHPGSVGTRSWNFRICPNVGACITTPTWTLSLVQ
jgi:hypothetical protein